MESESFYRDHARFYRAGNQQYTSSLHEYDLGNESNMLVLHV